MAKSRNSRRPKKSWQKMATARDVELIQGTWPNLLPAADVYHPLGESIYVGGWNRKSAAPKYNDTRLDMSDLGVTYAEARWAAYDSLCCQAVLPNRFTAESLCFAYRSSIDVAIYKMFEYDGRLQRGCGWLADEAFQLGMIAIWRHAPKSLERPTTPEDIGPDGLDIGEDLTDVASAYYRTIVKRALGKMRYAEWDRRKREKSTVTTYLRGQRRWHPVEDKWNTRMFWLPKNAWTPVAPPVIEDEESRHLKAVEAVTSACWTDLDRRIMALKEQGDLSDAEIGELVDKTIAQVNRAWHGVLERSEATLGLDSDNEKYRKCHRRKHRRDTLARWSHARAAFWSVAWISFHGNRRPDDPMPDTAGLFDEDGFKLGPLPRC